MDQQIEEYIYKFVTQAMESEYLSSQFSDKAELEEKLRQYFYGVVLDTLVDNLSIEQLEAFNSLDSDSDQIPEMIQLLASQVPNFLDLVDKALKEATEKIKSSGQIPSLEPQAES